MDVHPATFLLWRKQSERGDNIAGVDFAEVRVVSTPTTTAVTITLANGASASVPAGTDAIWVGQLVQSKQHAVTCSPRVAYDWATREGDGDK